MMDHTEHRTTILAFAGWMLCAWFVVESVHFLVSGQLWDLGRTLPQFFENSLPLGLYVIFHIIMASLGAFAAIPLLLRGRKAGLVLAIAYRLSGNTINPLSLLLPRTLLTAPDNEPTVLAQAMDVVWLLMSLAILVLFFLQRRDREE